MSKPECRESRSVPFDPLGIVWAAAAVEGGVKGSQKGVDESSELDKQGRLRPSPTRRPLPFQAQQPPGSLNASAATKNLGWASVASVQAEVAEPNGRPPLAPTQGNVDVVREVLSAEVRALERKVVGLQEQIVVQQSLIRGFCRGFCRGKLARQHGAGD